MIQNGTFSSYSYKQKYNFIVNILSRVKKQTLFDDLREIFRVIKKPNEELLTQIFEIIESVLIYSQKKGEKEKQQGLKLIQKKLQLMKSREHQERQGLKQELEELLLQLQ